MIKLLLFNNIFCLLDEKRKDIYEQSSRKEQVLEYIPMIKEEFIKKRKEKERKDLEIKVCIHN